MTTRMRKFESTHPWINFSAEQLRRASPRFWMRLGEARSKCEHIAQVPLQPGTAERLHQLYLAKGALATTAIEGNTLSEEEVVKHLEGKLKLPPSKEYLAKEIDNVVNACNWILQEIVSGKPPRLTAALIKDFNRRVLKGLNLAEEVEPGEIRSYAVGVARYRAVLPGDCEFLLDRTCEWLNGYDFTPAANGLADHDLSVAILKAAIAHLYLAWIHPFGDGNGRSARLVEFLIWLRRAFLAMQHISLATTTTKRELSTTVSSTVRAFPAATSCLSSNTRWRVLLMVCELNST